MKPLFSKNALILSFGIITLVFSIYLTGVISLLCDHPIGGFDFPLAIILFFVFFLCFTRQDLTIGRQFLLLSIILLLFFVAILLANYIYDTSWDGQWYHQLAIIKLKQGWNPYHHPFYKISSFEQKFDQTASSFEWIQHYPKFTWIYAATIFKFFGAVETGKGINLMLVATVFFNTLNFCAKTIKKREWCLVVAFLLAFDPIACSQLFTDYVDGGLVCLFILIIISLLNLELNEGKERKLSLTILAIAIIAASNIKFTGLVFSGILLFFFGIFWIWKKKPISVFMVIGSAFLFGVLVFGFNPYFENYQSERNPFYPMGEKNPNIFYPNTPKIMYNKNIFQDLFYTLVHSVDNSMTAKFEWKNPLEVKASEIKLFTTSDIRFSGFGPLFQLILEGSIILCVLVLINGKFSLIQALLFICAGWVIITTLINPMGWLARLSPQLYILPILFILTGLLVPGNNKFLTIFSKSLLLIMTINILLIMAASFSGALIKATNIRNELEGMKQNPKRLYVSFYNCPFQNIRERLKEFGINYVEVRDTLVGNDVREMHTMYKLNKKGPKFRFK